MIQVMRKNRIWYIKTPYTTLASLPGEGLLHFIRRVRHHPAMIKLSRT